MTQDNIKTNTIFRIFSGNVTAPRVTTDFRLAELAQWSLVGFLYGTIKEQYYVRFVVLANPDRVERFNLGQVYQKVGKTGLQYAMTAGTFSFFQQISAQFRGTNDHWNSFFGGVGAMSVYAASRPAPSKLTPLIIAGGLFASTSHYLLQQRVFAVDRS